MANICVGVNEQQRCVSRNHWRICFHAQLLHVCLLKSLSCRLVRVSKSRGKIFGKISAM